MNPQLELMLPIPIVEEIISFSTLSTKVTFRATCKRFLHFTTEQFFPTFTTTLCGNKNGYEDGDFVSAQFDEPVFGILNSSSTILYVSDYNNHVIRKMDLVAKRVTTLCGTPTKLRWKDRMSNEAQLWHPAGLALDKEGNLLYVADTYNHVIKSINLVDETVSTIAGIPGKRGVKDGVGNDATFDFPAGLALDSISSHLCVVDRNNHSIRRVFLKDKKVESLCGTGKKGYKDGSFDEATFTYPWNIVWNTEMQELYVSDCYNHIIRVLSLKNRTVSTLCGTPGVRGYENGVHTQTKFKYPMGLEFDAQSQCLYITDRNDVIRKVSLLEKRKVTTFCGTPPKGGEKDGVFSSFHSPGGIVMDTHSHSFYVIDTGNHKVRKIHDKKKALYESEIPSPPKKIHS